MRRPFEVINFQTLQETVITGAQDYFAHLLESVQQATATIDFEVYIFEPDAIGQALAAALIAARQRGVHVRLLVDGVGSAFLPPDFLHNLHRHGVQTRVYHPLPWLFWQWRYARVVGSWLERCGHAFTRLNRRNHRKVCIIDQTIAYVGSFNVSQVHFARTQGGAGWHDSGVRIQGLDLSQLSEAFQRAWVSPLQWPLSTFKRYPYYFRLNNTLRRRRFFRYDLRLRIRQAQRRIWITNAYFIPSGSLLRALVQASERGVDVRILLPRESDVFFMPWASALFYRDLIRSGVRIFEYLPSVLHQKTLILDDWVTLGSSNLNQRSVLHDLEVDVVLQHSHSKTRIEHLFLADLEQSEEMPLTDAIQPWYRYLIGRLTLFFRYWL